MEERRRGTHCEAENKGSKQKSRSRAAVWCSLDEDYTTHTVLQSCCDMIAAKNTGLRNSPTKENAKGFCGASTEHM